MSAEGHWSDHVTLVKLSRSNDGSFGISVEGGSDKGRSDLYTYYIARHVWRCESTVLRHVLRRVYNFEDGPLQVLGQIKNRLDPFKKSHYNWSVRQSPPPNCRSRDWPKNDR